MNSTCREGAVVKICECGSTFETTKADKKYCTITCQRRMSKRRYKWNHHEHTREATQSDLMTFSDISAATGIPESDVVLAYNKAIAKLRQHHPETLLDLLELSRERQRLVHRNLTIEVML